ncbi:MAG TPA: LPS assembly lipoprotein LptE [Planctomycetota bacterium]|nr:LPS assembly lipoprotein LptE [Planctomycetota bacterium]
MATTTERRSRRAAFARAVFAPCILVAAGCGYQTGSLLPGGATRVAVSMAGNDTFYRQDEFVYTRRLTVELIRRVGVEIREPRDADLILEARITDLRRTPLVEGRRDEVLEEGLVGRVEIVLRDAKTGAILDRFDVRRRSEAIFGRGENLGSARAELAAELAEDTVVALERRSYLVERGLVSDSRPRLIPIEDAEPPPAPDSAPADDAGR